MKLLKTLPLALLLCLCVCLLSACGSGESQSLSAPETDPAAANDTVYAASFHEISVDKDKNLEPLAFTGEGFYALSWEEIETPSSEEAESVTGYGQKLYYVNQNGEMTALSYSGSPAPADSEDRQDYSSGSNLQGLFALQSGELLAVESVYASWFEGPEDLSPQDPSYWSYYKNENSFTLLHLDAQGALLSAVPLDWDPDDEENAWLDFRSAVMDGEGRLVVTGQQKVYVFSGEGSLLGSIETDDWAGSPVLLRDGRAAVLASGRMGMSLMVLDLDNMQPSASLDLEQWPEHCFSGGGEYDVYYTSGTRLYGCRLADGCVEEVLNLLDCDLISDSLRFLRAEEDGSFHCCCLDQENLELVELKRVPRSVLPEKQLLTLGTLGGGDSVLSQVLRFNRRHEDVRIQVLDYSQSFADNAGDLDALTKLSTEIMAGSIPDLLCLDGLPYEQLAAKGLLEDLFPWLDGDGELSREDFLPSALRACSFGDGLYQIAPGFQIYTLIGASSVVGEEPGWSYEQLESALASMPEGCSILGPGVGRDEMLMRCLITDMGSYVDWENATCDFENEDFCALLEFCAEFPSQPDYSGTEYGRVAAGQQLLLDLNVSSLDEVGYADQYFGGRVTYVGLPSRSGSGSSLMLVNPVAMSASCQNKEAAWDFLRSFLLPDFQRQQYNLPLRKDVFDEQLEDAMRIEYEMDENGQPRLDENGEKIPISRGGMGMASEDGEMLSFEFYGLTQEQADRFCAMLDSAQSSPSFNSTVFEMVQTEAASFFAGERSAEDTAKLIQSKVSLYLAEQH